MTLNEITFRVDKIHNVLVLAIWMKSNKSPWSLSFNSSKCPKLAKIKFGNKLAVQSIKTFTSVENVVSIFSMKYLLVQVHSIFTMIKIERFYSEKV